jgi:CRP-like cAMP-binding protein
MIKVHSYKSGDHFGDLALFYVKKRAATVITTSACHMAVLTKDDFTNML